MGDRILYLKILRRFLHDHGTTPCQIRAEFDTGNYASARLKAHTLKGAAGMIGARHVHSLSETLESALRAQARPGPADAAAGTGAGSIARAVSSMRGTPEAAHTAGRTWRPTGRTAIQLLLAPGQPPARRRRRSHRHLENSASLLRPAWASTSTGSGRRAHEFDSKAPWRRCGALALSPLPLSGVCTSSDTLRNSLQQNGARHRAACRSTTCAFWRQRCDQLRQGRQ